MKKRVMVYIFSLCSILLVAVYVPNLVSAYLQKSLEGKISYVDVGVKTYEVKYNTIWEKIVSIKKCEEETGELRTFLIAMEITEKLRDSLTQHVKQQLDLLQEGIVGVFFNISEENLISCKKYGIYSSNEANGISFWYLKYQNKDETIQLIMDTEFYSIYRFELSTKDSYGEAVKDYVKQDKKKIAKKGEDYSYDYVFRLWTKNLSEYFNIAEDKFIYIMPDVKDNIFHLENLFFSCGLNYEDINNKEDKKNTDSWVSEYNKNISSSVSEDKKNMSSSGSKDATVSVDESDEMWEKMNSKNIIPIFCEYQWNDNRLILNWGFECFDTMMQL